MSTTGARAIISSPSAWATQPATATSMCPPWRARFSCRRRALLVEGGDVAKVGKHLLRRLFADVAGVEDDEIGVIGARRRRVTERRHQFGDARPVVHVHLAAVILDEDLLRHRHP